MSKEKKTAVTEEVKEEVRKFTEEELEQVTGGVTLENPLGGQVDPTKRLPEPPSPVAGSGKTAVVAATQTW